jgi:hypothetical protein
MAIAVKFEAEPTTRDNSCPFWMSSGSTLANRRFGTSTRWTTRNPGGDHAKALEAAGLSGWRLASPTARP